MRPSPTRGLRFLEAEGMGYAIRLPANSILQSKIGYLLKRPVGRTAHDLRRYFASFSYQAESWRKPRRVVAKVEWHSRASALSSSTWFVRPSALSPSTIGAAQRAIDQGGQGCNQVDAAVVPDVRRQRGASAASCTRLQSRQFRTRPLSKCPHAVNWRTAGRKLAQDSGQTDQAATALSQRDFARPVRSVATGRLRAMTAR